MTINASFTEVFDLNTTAQAMSWEVRDLWAGQNATMPLNGTVQMNTSTPGVVDTTSQAAMGVSLGRVTNNLSYSVKSHGTKLLRLRMGQMSA